jgi:predicted RNase H-like HicB family nuclease
MKTYTSPAIIQRDADGYYGERPSLQGCFTQGASYEEVIKRLRDAIRTRIMDRIEAGEEIESSDLLRVTTLEVVA